jgi:hypothetical protein
MSGLAFAVGLAAFVVAGLADLIAGARRDRVRAVPYLIGAAGVGCVAVAGAACLAGRPLRLPVAGWLGNGTGDLAMLIALVALLALVAALA